MLLSYWTVEKGTTPAGIWQAQTKVRNRVSLFEKLWHIRPRGATSLFATMGAPELDGEVPIVEVELYNTDFNAFVEVRSVPTPDVLASSAIPTHLVFHGSLRSRQTFS